MQNYRLGNKVKEPFAATIVSRLSNLKSDSEKILGIYKASKLKPMLEAIVITNVRVLGVTNGLQGVAFASELNGDEVASVQVEPISLSRMAQLKIETKDGRTVRYADIMKVDADEIVKLISSTSGTTTPLSEAVGRQREAAAATRLDEKAKWQSLVVGHVNGATLNEAKKSCNDGEMPEFIIGQIGYGALAAFEDRCIVIKKGLLTSFMASSLGGGRTATFYYRDITGIEYNSGIMTGVLEILTPSYSGKETNSPWAFGSDRSAHESSNTLPWSRTFYNDVRTQIEWLRRKIQEAKTNQGVTAPQALSVADELSKLAELHKQGILTSKEFEDAKGKIINK